MSEYVTDQMQYVDGSRVIRKSTWYDPATGASWDTFDDAGDAPQGAQSGSVVTQNNPFSDPYASAAYSQSQNPQANTPSAGQPATSLAQSGSTKAGTGPYASTSTTAAGAVQSAASGASQSAPGGSSQVPPAGNPFTPANPADQQRVRGNFLYPENDPQTALANTLRQMGLYNQGSPMTQTLMRAAPGLSTAYAVGNVAQNRPADTFQDSSTDFGGFLRDIISGKGGQSIGSAVNTARGQLGSVVPSLFQAGQETDPNAVNPFVQFLKQALEAGNGRGLGGAFSSLGSALLNPLMSQAYTGGLQNAVSGAQANFGQSDNIVGDQRDIGNYFLQYLMNGGR